MTSEQMIQLMQAFKPQAQAGPDLAGLAAILNAPKGRHLGIGGAEITQANPMGNAGGDPFTNGFFKHPTSGPMNVLAGSSPMQVKQAQMPGMLPEIPEPMPPMFQNQIPFGQGMINPQLPDAQKYGDGNFWSAVGTVPQTGWQPGMSMRDETGNQYAGVKPKPKKPAKGSFAFGTSRPSFSF